MALYVFLSYICNLNILDICHCKNVYLFLILLLISECLSDFHFFKKSYSDIYGTFLLKEIQTILKHCLSVCGTDFTCSARDLLVNKEVSSDVRVMKITQIVERKLF